MKKKVALFIGPTEAVQTFSPQIADFVTKTYKAQQAKFFLEDADPWVIAHAKIENAIVVTQETLVPSVSSQVKIPNICNQFGVKWIDLYALLRELKAQLILKA